MSKLLTLFYCLPPEGIVLGFFLASLLFVRLHAALGSRRWFHLGMIGFLIAWFSVTVWTTVLVRSGGRIFAPELIPFHSYRKMLATGNIEILRANFMNMALFYPAGLLLASALPRQLPPTRRIAAVAMPMLALSIGIEYAQFRWALGDPEMDDVIHNTLGAVLGCLFAEFGDPCQNPPK